MHHLPKDIMEAQISTVDLLLAMFPDPSEIDISPEALQTLDTLRGWTTDECPEPPSRLPTDLTFAILLAIDPNHTIQLNLSVPLCSPDPAPLEAPPLAFSLRQPIWLPRAEYSDLSSQLPADDVFSAIDYIRDCAPEHLAKATSTASLNSSSTAQQARSTPQHEPLCRVWFYFPSLSTREKRSDMVHAAPSYSLTGFVLAGKPGLLCLEGASSSVDAYMKYIKRVSWGDIPSHQKKVSERYREDGVGARAFSGMSEITDVLGERHGARQNRGDMAALEGWLREMGVGEAFERVIMQQQ